MDFTSSHPKELKNILQAAKCLVFILFLLGLVLSPTSLKSARMDSRWTEHKISGSDRWDFTSSSDGTKIAAASYIGGYIYTSTDSGATWTKKASAGSRKWSSITSSADGTKIAAVVDGGYIYTSTDSGNTWVEHTSLGVRAYSQIVSSNDGSKLAARVFSWDPEDYAVVVSVDSGNTWTDRGVGTPWYTIQYSGDGSKLFGGAWGGKFSVSNDNGISWTAQLAMGNGYWYDIEASDDGSAVVATSIYKIFTTVDGGTNWLNRTGFASDYCYRATISSDGSKMSAECNGVFYTSGDFGANWTAQSKSFIDNIQLAASADGTKIFASDGSIYFSNDSGVTWTERLIDSNTSLWNSVTSSADGMHLAASSYLGSIYTSSDGGQTWAKRGAESKGWVALTSSTNGTKLAAVSTTNTGGYIYTSNNGGASWTEHTDTKANGWYNIASSSDGTKLFAYGIDWDGGYLYNSVDSGENWVERTALGVASWYAISSSADGNKLVAGDGYGPSWEGGPIYTSNDGGNTWEERTDAGLHFWCSIASSADGTKLAATTCENYVYVSTDGGVNWSEKTLEGDFLDAIAFSGDGEKIFVADEEGYLYSSEDEGQTWTAEIGAGERNWSSIAASNDGNRVVAVVEGGSIWTGILDDTLPTFTNLPGSTSPINVTEGQTITTNPYVIQVKPEDNIEIDYVEFYIDDNLICTDSEADDNGIYSCSWDTSKYHSLISVIAYDTTGNQSTLLTRNTTVDPALYELTVLPKTGFSGK